MSRSKPSRSSLCVNVALAACLSISAASRCSAEPGMKGMQGMQGMQGMKGMRGAQSNDTSQRPGAGAPTTLRGRLEAGEKDARGNPTSLSFVTDDRRLFTIRDEKKVAELTPHIGHEMTVSGRVGDSIDVQGSAGSSTAPIPDRTASQPRNATPLQVESFQLNNPK